MNFLVLIGDAFGGTGGIAKVNRDLLKVLCSYERTEQVVAVPRVISQKIGHIPTKLLYEANAAGSIGNYLRILFKLIFGQKKYSIDVVICGHINLIPFAMIIATWYKVPCVLIIHGIEAWEEPKGYFRKSIVKKIDYIISVSEFTKRKFIEWSSFDEGKITVIPNCVELNKFSPGPKPEYLKQRYGLVDHTLILTLGRLAGRDRAKGFDEILEILPDLLIENPSIRYMVAGDGKDKTRLEKKAKDLGLGDKVIFTGYVSEEEKADYYRLADVFAMPGKGEGFGIVYIEALACGTPVVASTMDASGEAVLNGELGIVVNPEDYISLKKGILESFNVKDINTKKLEHFSYNKFEKRWYQYLNSFQNSNAQF